MQPLPITGYALCNALGPDRDAVLEALAEERSGLGASPIELSFPTAVGAVRASLPELEGELAPWSTRLARMGARMLRDLEPAVERARRRWDPDRIAVVLGTSTAGADRTEQAYRHYVDHGALPADYDFRKQHTYGALLHVLQELTGAAGPAWMISTACSSSAKPLASAQRLLAADVADAVLVGGIDALCAMTLQGFRSLGVLSDGPCRPFSEGRDGISIGEGGALMLVERDGDPVALLEGAGESSDAYHVSAPHPEGRGALEAVRGALDQAGCAPEDVDHVNAHGTGTPLNDLAESKALAEALPPEVPVVSTKGYTGHTLGAAGATEAALALLSMEEGWIPASTGARPVDPAIRVRVPVEAERTPVRRVLSNSFAFGGNNISVLLRAP